MNTKLIPYKNHILAYHGNNEIDVLDKDTKIPVSTLHMSSDNPTEAEIKAEYDKKIPQQTKDSTKPAHWYFR
jgi:hypothetical protein